MTRTRALPVVLQVLDDGLRLYRRHLAAFVLVATTVLVALALLAMSFMAFVRTELGGSGWTVLAVVMIMACGYPLTLYGFAALSRAASDALDGRPITVLSALGLSPGRGCGMVLFNLLFGFFASMGASIISAIIACPLLYFPLLGIGFASSLSDSTASAAASVVLGVVISQIGTLWSISVSGGWLASMIYSVQPFALEQRTWGAAASRALDVLFARFWQSLLMFLGAGAIFGTLIIAYFGSLLVLFAMLEDRLSLDLPPLAGDIFIIVVLVSSLVVLLPPMAIWMTMFFRHTARERDGNELAARVAAWHAQVGQPA